MESSQNAPIARAGLATVEAGALVEHFEGKEQSKGCTQSFQLQSSQGQASNRLDEWLH